MQKVCRKVFSIINNIIIKNRYKIRNDYYNIENKIKFTKIKTKTYYITY